MCSSIPLTFSPQVIELGQNLTGGKGWTHTPWCFMHQASSLGLRYWHVPHPNFDGDNGFDVDLNAVVAALAALDLTY
jgi:hypothetical protein